MRGAERNADAGDIKNETAGPEDRRCEQEKCDSQRVETDDPPSAWRRHDRVRRRLLR